MKRDSLNGTQGNAGMQRRQPVRTFGRKLFTATKRTLQIVGATILIARAVNAQTIPATPVTPTPAPTTAVPDTTKNFNAIQAGVEGGHNSNLGPNGTDRGNNTKYSAGYRRYFQGGFTVGGTAFVERQGQERSIDSTGAPSTGGGAKVEGSFNGEDVAAKASAEISSKPVVEADGGNATSFAATGFAKWKIDNQNGIYTDLALQNLSYKDNTSITNGHAFIGADRQVLWQDFAAGVFGGYENVSISSNGRKSQDYLTASEGFVLGGRVIYNDGATSFTANVRTNALTAPDANRMIIGSVKVDAKFLSIDLGATHLFGVANEYTTYNGAHVIPADWSWKLTVTSIFSF